LQATDIQAFINKMQLKEFEGFMAMPILKELLAHFYLRRILDKTRGSIFGAAVLGLRLRHGARLF